MYAQELLLIRRKDLWLQNMLEIDRRQQLCFLNVLIVRLRDRRDVRSVLWDQCMTYRLEVISLLVTHRVFILAVVVL